MSEGGLQSVVICEVDGKPITLGDIAPVLKVEGRWSLVDEAIREAVLDQAIRSDGITVTEAELQAAANDFRRVRKLHGADEMKEWLQASKMSADTFEKGLIRHLSAAKLRENIDQDEVRRYFFDNLRQFQWARFSQIVSKERDTAEELLAQIRDEEADFAGLAARHSIDSESRFAGGYVGTVKRGDLPPQLEPIVFSVDPESVADPVETPRGWHLIKVWQRGGGELDDNAAAQARDALFERWLRRQIERARVDAKL